ncbi:lipase maturation factor [Chloropicon primus]|uniref:Lipase maturation factor 2 n=1 Tax=Chloropicon primus TaxID=1764295 RepID=A0A5B8MP42_9CHLO|nr:lipase maturation factor [Chloropicon primus]UPR00314.1 lipase maturation factor [Chloropicon primus]|eukprot:QDZ21100.1 lipase maturation factor [Chloropicon primus]
MAKARGRLVGMPTYEVTADVFLRFLSLVYLFAFVSLWTQLPGLYSREGILPIERLLEHQVDTAGLETGLDVLKRHPSLVVLGVKHFGYDADVVLESVVLMGVATSLVSVCYGWCGSVLMFIQYLLYLSVMRVGQTFLSFQWDALLLEIGFASIFLARLGVSARWSSRHCRERPPLAALFLVRFILFKLMLMSGVVKIQADCPTWLNLTACHYHFATQCIPTPLAWFFSNLPPLLLKLSVAATLWIEIAAPVLILLPFVAVQKFAAVVQITLQAFILVTGNYNFFNLLTVALCLTLLDLGKGGEVQATRAGKESKRSLLDTLDEKGPLGLVYHLLQKSNLVSYTFCLAFAAYTGYLMFHFQLGPGDASIDLLVTKRSLQRLVDAYLPLILSFYGVATVLAGLHDVLGAVLVRKGKGVAEHVKDIAWKATVMALVVCVFTAGFVPITQLSPRASKKLWPAVKSAYDLSAEWHIVSGYGLFRRMTGVGDVEGQGDRIERPELEIQGSLDGEVWVPYNFTYKPGPVGRPPPWAAPHQPRLDWQMWFAALHREHDLWFIHFIYKLLLGEPCVLGLMGAGNNPTFEKNLPEFIRVIRYHYNFTTPGDSDWWNRTEDKDNFQTSLHLRPLRKDDESLLEILKQYRFKVKESLETAEDWVSQKEGERRGQGQTTLGRIWVTRRFEIACTFFTVAFAPSLVRILGTWFNGGRKPRR